MANERARLAILAEHVIANFEEEKREKTLFLFKDSLKVYEDYTNKPKDFIKKPLEVENLEAKVFIYEVLSEISYKNDVHFAFYKVDDDKLDMRYNYHRHT
jgi:hypothetical protein